MSKSRSQLILDEILSPVTHALPLHSQLRRSYKGRAVESVMQNPNILFTSAKLAVLLQRAMWDDGDDYCGFETDAPSIPTKTIRYVVCGEKLFFAREGSCSSLIPAHGEMATTCHAAGNMVFDEFGVLIKINNKSGDFRPSPQTLPYALAAIIKCGIPVANNLSIEVQGSAIAKQFSTTEQYSWADLKQRIAEWTPSQVKSAPVATDSEELSASSSSMKNNAALSSKRKAKDDHWAALGAKSKEELDGNDATNAAVVLTSVSSSALNSPGQAAKMAARAAAQAAALAREGLFSSPARHDQAGMVSPKRAHQPRKLHF